MARITGLNAFVTTSRPVADVLARPAGAAARWPVSPAGRTRSPATVWAEGNILLGGAGSDLIEGRGTTTSSTATTHSAWISVRDQPADPATEIGWTDLMEDGRRPGASVPEPPA